MKEWLYFADIPNQGALAYQPGSVWLTQTAMVYLQANSYHIITNHHYVKVIPEPQH